MGSDKGGYFLPLGGPGEESFREIGTFWPETVKQEGFIFNHISAGKAGLVLLWPAVSVAILTQSMGWHVPTRVGDLPHVSMVQVVCG